MAKFIKKLLRALIVLLVALAVAGAGMGAYWVFGKLKNRQSWRMIRKGELYAAQGKWTEATMCLETALRLRPGNPVALRMLANVQESQGSISAALGAWQKLAEGGSLQLQDLRQYAVTAAKQGNWPLAERVVASVAVRGLPAASHLMRAELMLLKNDFAQAESEIRLAAQTDNTHQSKVVLSRFLISNRLNSQTAPEVLAILRELSKRDDAIGAEALANALSNGLVPESEIPGWIAALRSHKNTDTGVLLLADSAEIKFRPASKHAVIDNVVSRMKDAPVATRLEGMDWLIRCGEPGLAAGLLTREEALQTRPTLMLWMDANYLTKNTAPILDILAQEKIPLPDHMRKLYRGRALIMSGKTEEGKKEFEEAYALASGNPADFFETVSYLGLAGENDLFEKGLKQMFADPNSAEAALGKMIAATRSRRDSEILWRICNAAAESPVLEGNLSLLNDLAYLDILLGKQTDTAPIELRSQENPRDFAFRVTLGLSLLRDGKKKEALEILKSSNPPVRVMTLAPHQKAVVAAALAANGLKPEAFQAASLVSPQALSAQEVRLLKSYLDQILEQQAQAPEASEKNHAPKK